MIYLFLVNVTEERTLTQICLETYNMLLLTQKKEIILSPISTDYGMVVGKLIVMKELNNQEM